MKAITQMLQEALHLVRCGDFMYAKSRSLEIKAFRGEIASLLESADTWVSSRVYAEGKLGTAYTEQVDIGMVRRAAEQAAKNATFADPDPGNRLYDGGHALTGETGGAGGDFDGRRGSLASRTTDEKKAMALAAERAARAVDPRIVNVPYCYYFEEDDARAIAATSGLAKTRLGASCGCFVAVMAKDGDETQTGSEYAVAAGPDELDMEAAARTAARRALEKLGAQEIDSGEYRVVFDNLCASQLLGAFVASPASPFYGENLQKGRSMLAGKLNEKIGSDLFTIIDDPTRGLSPVFFDGDGVGTAALTLVDGGVFRSVVHTVYSAAREDGEQTTGHAKRGMRGVRTGLHHPHLLAGSQSVEALIGALGTGLFVTEMAGLHAGLNPITGDFSLSAKGFLVESGRCTTPFTNAVVAGNFFDLASGVAMKANDIRTDTQGGFDAPSVLIEKLSVSGR